MTAYTILAVDDSPENLDLIKNILQPFYTVKVAPKGSLALQIAHSQKLDLILLDIMLEDIDGYEICRQLKSASQTRDIPVIFLTAKASEADEVEGFKIGGCDYITKPFSPAVMLARIKTHIQLKVKTELLERLACLDGLTEIPNRRAFDSALQQQFKQAEGDATPLSLLIMDIDHFKAFNDYYGHPVGDDCLQQIASTLSQHTPRPEDLVARLGGEEFGILLRNTDMISATLRAEQYQTAIARLKIPQAAGSPQPYISASFGVATIVANNDNQPQQLLKAADDALYRAKKQGRNQICTENLCS